MVNNETVLSVRNLSISFRMYDSNSRMTQFESQAVKNVSLSVEKGEILSVIGSSGSGKSLLAHAVLGILPENAECKAEIEFHGKKMALIPQSVSYLDPLKKVKNQLSVKRLSEEELVSIAERFYLKRKDLEKYPFELSGGMARRVLIATAFCSGADFIIADEPTPGLSTALSDEILGYFREYVNRGNSMLLISHDIDLISEVADRMAVFHNGTIIDTISTSDFKNGPSAIRHPFTKALWSALPQNDFKFTMLQ